MTLAPVESLARIPDLVCAKLRAGLVEQGYTDGATKYWEEDPVWNLDAVLLPFRDLPNVGRLVGYAGPPGRAAAEVVTKYIIVDMYAKAVQGMPAEDAVKWAHGELVKIYA